MMIVCGAAQFMLKEQGQPLEVQLAGHPKIKIEIRKKRMMTAPPFLPDSHADLQGREIAR